jgi:hypothetical protein
MIMEFRTYTMVPGARAEFVEFFKTQAMPLMAAVGMNVVGQFSSVTDENVFAYARTFDSIEQREAQYKAYYESEDWLGWMIDTAMGKEESFIVFLGDDEPRTDTPLSGMAGTHAARFTLASSRGTIAAVSADSITVDGDDGVTVTYELIPEGAIWFTPNGRGLGRAQSITVADLAVGDVVLVLGASTDDGAIARQVVKRPS